MEIKTTNTVPVPSTRNGYPVPATWHDMRSVFRRGHVSATGTHTCPVKVGPTTDGPSQGPRSCLSGGGGAIGDVGRRPAYPSPLEASASSPPSAAAAPQSTGRPQHPSSPAGSSPWTTASSSRRGLRLATNNSQKWAGGTRWRVVGVPTPPHDPAPSHVPAPPAHRQRRSAAPPLSPRGPQPPGRPPRRPAIRLPICCPRGLRHRIPSR